MHSSRAVGPFLTFINFEAKLHSAGGFIRLNRIKTKMVTAINIDKKIKILYITPLMKHLILFICTLLMFVVISCKTTAKPIVYDKNLPEIRKELMGINLMMRQGELADASKRLEKAIVLYPENRDLKTIRCFLLIEMGKNQEALDLINNLILQMPENALLYTALGMLNVKSLAFAEALENFEKSINLSHSRLAFPWFQKGLFHYQQKDYEKSSECFFKAKQIEARNPDFHFFYFLCQLYITKNLDANMHLWKSTENKIDEIPVWYYSFYVQALYDIGYKEDAVKLLTDGLKKYPQDLYLRLFHCCIRLDEIKETGSISDKMLGDEIRDVLLKLPCPEAADAWITWLELSGDARLVTECRKYMVVYSYSPLVQEWSQKMQNKD